MSGEGFVFLDIVLTVLCCFAAFAQIICARREWADARCVNFYTLLRAAGWFVICVRFSFVLAERGDLMLPLPSLIAMLCLALAEFTAAALYKR